MVCECMCVGSREKGVVVLEMAGFTRSYVQQTEAEPEEK